MMTYEECANYISSIHKFQENHSHEDTRRLLKRLYTDEKPKIIHVAGTNGKGSTSAYIAGVLKEAGYKVGLFTSPHLVSMTERVAINGQKISEDDFVQSFYAVMDAIKEEGLDYQPSFFKFIFLLAMHYFGKNKLDAIVLETGLGGRLDATNSILKKDLCVITKIGLDHTEILGETIEQIAYEKAGIIKEGVPTVFYNNDDASKEVIMKVCNDKNSTCYLLDKDEIFVSSVDKEGIDFSINSKYYKYDSLRVSAQALYQSVNASLAVLAVKVLGDSHVTDKNIYDGLLNTSWAGRMEEFEPGVYLDGAHNPDGIEAFLKSVERISCTGKRHLLFSVVSDKQYEIMIKLIAESKLFDDIFVASMGSSSRALDLDNLKKAFLVYPELNVYFCDSVLKAYTSMKRSKAEGDLAFVAGSLYLVGAISGS